MKNPFKSKQNAVEPNESNSYTRYGVAARINSDLLAEENERLYKKIDQMKKRELQLLAKIEQQAIKIEEYQNKFN